MRVGRKLDCLVVVLVLLVGAGVPLASGGAKEVTGGGWPPIPEEDLALKEIPFNQGLPAVILMREVRTDDMKSLENNFVRIKILTEEGKKYGDVEIPYWREAAEISGIKARAVQPDGTAVEFDGKVYDKTIVKSKRWKYKAKTFAIPNVQVGSIIEYKYYMTWTREVLYNSRWRVQEDLYTRRAKFTIVPYDKYNRFRIFYTWSFPPSFPKPQLQQDYSVALDIQNVPAFKEEEYTPPEDSLRYLVDFFYVEIDKTGTDSFWKDAARSGGKTMDGFIGNRSEVKQAVAELIGPTDPPEDKLRKLYVRVQQIRNLSSERGRTEEEKKKEDLKINLNVADVLKRGYGTGYDINMLFVAMARAAGFHAWPVHGASRRDHLFTAERLSEYQLDALAVEVWLGDKSVFLDPATPFCPYGLLPWEEANVQGIRKARDAELNDLKTSGASGPLTSNGKPGVYMTTSKLTSAQAVIARKAELRLEAEGEVSGKILVKYVGQEALTRRLDNLDENEGGRRKELEDEVKGWLSVAGATVELKNTPAWEEADEALEAEFTVKLPGLGTPAGRRLLLPLAVFRANQPAAFQAGRRTHPIDLHYPYQIVDDVTLRLPAGMQIDTLPAPRKRTEKFGRYQSSYLNAGGTLRFQRTMVLEETNFQMFYYPDLRAFFNAARLGDEDQAVIRMGEIGAAN